MLLLPSGFLQCGFRMWMGSGETKKSSDELNLPLGLSSLITMSPDFLGKMSAKLLSQVVPFM